MPYIIGRAKSEDELFGRYRDFITGVAWQHSVEYTGAGTGKVIDVRIQEGFEYETFTLTCVSVGQKGGTFSVTGSVSGTLPDAVVNEVYYQNQIQFYIDYGVTDFSLGDKFTITSRETSVPTKPKFSHVTPTRDSVTSTITVSCTKMGEIENSEDQIPAVPAEFSVTSTAGGSLGTYTQGQEFVSSLAKFSIPHEKSTEDQQFLVGDELKFHFTENEFKTLDQRWEMIWNESFNEGTEQFGEPIKNLEMRAIFKGTGLAGENDVFSFLERNWFASGTAYWELSYLSGFNPDLHWQEQPGLITDYSDQNETSTNARRPVHSFWDGELYYWIIANGRRVITCTKSSNYYHQSYQGLYIPFASPQYEPYPVITGGSGTTLSTGWNNTSAYNCNFWNPSSTESNGYYASLRLLTSSGGQHRFINYTNGSYQINRTGETFPYGAFGMNQVRSNLDGSFPVFKVGLYSNYGEMDGVYAVPGTDGQQSEDLLDFNDRKMVVFQNIYRLGVSDFVAMELS
ncbi:hypothetical protein [Endozoicomonas sp. ALC066]|uniref:hypothetical protein n=1 Tax=Endozoicomonas sp. ALC066 TaxID=3403078 RepID=UPI003BB5CD03